MRSLRTFVVAALLLPAPLTAQDQTGLKYSTVHALGIDPACIANFWARGIAELAEQRMKAESLNNDRAYSIEAAHWIGVMQSQKFPAALIRKVMCGQPAIGMDGQMLLLAKGTPERKISEETAQGTVEIQNFDDGITVVLANGRVVKITRVERGPYQ